MKHTIAELDCFFLSYDEPNKETHWAMLQYIAPWSKRVDGVKGFDSAHKACAMQSETPYLITIDGDNQVSPDFFELEIEVPYQFQDCVLSWNSRNIINGLTYGNGGIKLWPKEFVLNMRSHENATEDTHAVDFCWDRKYIQLINTYSSTHPNGSPLQAFRAGFREGCKMTLQQGLLIEQVETIFATIDDITAQRLLCWGSLGMEIENGNWAILGTRVGMHYTNVQRRDINVVRDYNDFYQIVGEEWLKTPIVAFDEILTQLNAEIYAATGFKFYDFDAAQSKFIKSLMPTQRREFDPFTTEMKALGRV